MAKNCSSTRPGGAWWVAISGFAGAVAALALPGPTGATAAIASVLAVGALALLAGHDWGLLIVAVADVLLLGHAWPLLIFGHGQWTHAASSIALACALPGLALLGDAAPALVAVIVGDRPSRRVHSAGLATCAVFGALALVLPAL